MKRFCLLFCVLLGIAGMMGFISSCEGVEQDPEEAVNEGEYDPGDDPEDDDQGESDPSGTGKDDIVTDSGDDGGTLNLSDYTKIIDISWNGTSVTVTNGSSLTVEKDGANVTIGNATSAGEAVRINLSGSSTDGSLKIYNGVKANSTNAKMCLCFNGVDLTSQTRPAINIQSGKTVYVLLSDGTSNHLCDATSYTSLTANEDAKGCFFSEKQLVFSGEGSLTLEGKSKHALCVDNYITFRSGKLIITESASDGIHLNEAMRIYGGSISIKSKGEGIQCEKVDEGWLSITGGSVDITTSGERCGGIETASDILIKGGNVKITATGLAAKCLKSDNNISISGGSLTLSTTGGGMYDSTAQDAKAAACIAAENIITFDGGTITCKSTGNGGKGVNGYKVICNEGTVLDVTTNGSTYTYNRLTCRPKAIKATDGLTVNGGDITILTSGTEGEGMESKSWVEINGGKIAIQAKDDGINAGTTVTINGGYVYAYSTSNDGIDSNYGKSGAIVVNGGVVMAHSAQSPEEGFDADSHTYLTFNGGIAFCTGGQQGGGGMGGGGRFPGGGGGTSTSNAPSCKQSTYLWSGSAKVGYFTIADASGKVIMSCYVPRALSQNYSLISAPLTSGTSYKYGIVTSAPTGASEEFGKYFYGSGTVSGLSSSLTASNGYSSL